MRIGVRLGHREVSAVGVPDDGPIENARATASTDLASSVAEALAGLRGCRDARQPVIVFEVSEVLTADTAPTVLVRIAPRPPRGRGRAQSVPGMRGAKVVHVAGGHSILGRELVGLDEAALHRAAQELPADAHLVVTSVGSLVNADHERRAAEILRDGPAPRSMELGSSYFSNSIREREHTAMMNCALTSSADQHTDAIALGARRLFGDARLFVATNDGGCSPLSRLPTMPVHAAVSAPAAELLGAGKVAGVRDGRIAVVALDGGFVGELFDGLPSAGATPVLAGTGLASVGANRADLTDISAARRDDVAGVVAVGEPATRGHFGLAPAVSTRTDLVALGAAVAPVSHYHQRLVTASTAEDLRNAISQMCAAAVTQLVALGAPPPQVQVRQSQTVSTTYGDPRVARLRVRAITDPRTMLPVDSGPAGAVA